MRTIRASAIPLLLACPESHADGLRIDSDNQQARLGSAAHAGLAQFIREGEPPVIRDLALRFGVEDERELGVMVGIGQQAWRELGAAFPDPLVEASLSYQIHSELWIDGHPDVISLPGNEVRVLDWKTGRRHKDFVPQLAAYGLLAMVLGPTVRSVPDRVSLSVCWLRDGQTQTVHVGGADLLKLANDVGHAAESIGTGAYRTGEQCEFCPRACECPARTALARNSIQIVSLLAGDGIAALGDKLPEVYAGVKCAERACENFRSALRAQIEAHGPIEAGGRRYELVEQQRRELDPAKAWPVLSGHLTDAELAPAVKISLTTALDAVAAKAPRGQKGKAKEAVSAELEAAGAVSHSAFTKLAETEL